MLQWRAFDNATLRTANKINNTVALGGCRHLVFDGFEGIGHIAIGGKYATVYLLQLWDLLIAESTTAQAYDVEPDVRYGCASSHNVGGDILIYRCATLYHNVWADVGKLVYKWATTDYSVVINNHFACQLCGIRYDDVVAQYTVVSNVAVGHNKTVAAYYGATLGGCASVYGYTLAQYGVVAYLGCGVFALKFKVLRYGGYGNTGENFANLTDACAGV